MNKDLDQAQNSAMHFFGNLSRLSAKGATVAIMYAIDYIKPATIVERNQESTSQQNMFPILTVTRQKFDNVIEGGRQDIGRTADGFRQIGEESQAFPSRFSSAIGESFNNIKMAFNGEKYAAQVNNFSDALTEGFADFWESQADVNPAPENNIDLPTGTTEIKGNKFNDISSDQSPLLGGKNQMDSSDESIFLGDPPGAIPFVPQASESDDLASETNSTFNNPQFLYSVHPIRGSQAKMDNKDAAAIASLLYSKKGDRVEGGAGLVVRSGKEILFQVDANGIVQKSAFEERPGLMTDQRMMKAYGISNLKQYADFLSNTNASDTEVLRDSGNSNSPKDDIDRSTVKLAAALPSVQNPQNNRPAEMLTAMYNNVLQPALSEQGKSIGTIAINDRLNLSVISTQEGLRIDSISGSKSTTLGQYSQKTGMVASPSFASDRSLQTQMREALSQRSINIDSPTQTVDRQASDFASSEQGIPVDNPIDVDSPIEVNPPVKQKQVEMD